MSTKGSMGIMERFKIALSIENEISLSLPMVYVVLTTKLVRLSFMTLHEFIAFIGGVW